MKNTAYLVQATLISIWWIGLSLDDQFFNAFQFPGIGPKAFNAFLLPDIIVIAVMSVIRAYRPWRELEYIVLGGLAFGALYCVNASVITSGGFLGTMTMCLGLAFNIFLVFDKHLFRVSRSNDMMTNGIKTLVQIMCVWFMTLVLFPWMITEAFERSIEPVSQASLAIGAFTFVVFSLLGIASAYNLVKNGNGTPLPLDQTSQLVVSGPYQWVRNPMAIAGVGQGLSISLILGSVPILMYCILGAVIWQLVVRPVEERNMTERFGPEYIEYQSQVRCWLPRINK